MRIHHACAAALCAACLLSCPSCAPTAPAPSAAPPGLTVRTDWSHLGPYAPEESVYTRRDPAFTDDLVPAGDYGPLLPFLGGKLGGTDLGSRYGLMTLEGQVVVDPVYATVWDGSFSMSYHDSRPLPYYMLYKGAVSDSEDFWPDEPGGWAMAARDGSWCTDFRYTMDGELTIWGRGINENATDEGLFVLDGDALVYLDGASGQELLRLAELPGRMTPHDALWRASWSQGTATLRTSGTLGWQIDAATLEAREVDHLPPERNDFDQPPRLTGVGAAGEGEWGWYRDGEDVVFLRGTETHTLRTDADPTGLLWGRVLVLDRPEGDGVLATLDGAVLQDPLSGPAFDELLGFDRVTGAPYFRVRRGRRVDFYDERGALLASSPCAPNETAELAGDRFLVTGPGHCTLLTQDGTVLFRWLLPIAEWD